MVEKCYPLTHLPEGLMVTPRPMAIAMAAARSFFPAPALFATFFSIVLATFLAPGAPDLRGFLDDAAGNDLRPPFLLFGSSVESADAAFDLAFPADFMVLVLFRFASSSRTIDTFTSGMCAVYLLHSSCYLSGRLVGSNNDL